MFTIHLLKAFELSSSKKGTYAGLLNQLTSSNANSALLSTLLSQPSSGQMLHTVGSQSLNSLSPALFPSALNGLGLLGALNQLNASSALLQQQQQQQQQNQQQQLMLAHLISQQQQQQQQQSMNFLSTTPALNSLIGNNFQQQQQQQQQQQRSQTIKGQKPLDRKLGLQPLKETNQDEPEDSKAAMLRRLVSLCDDSTCKLFSTRHFHCAQPACSFATMEESGFFQHLKQAHDLADLFA